jgi:hypothetical protein
VITFQARTDKPTRRRSHGMAIHQDYLYVYGPAAAPPPRRRGAPPALTAGGAARAGGESSECEEQVCGDLWVYHLTFYI